MEEACGFVAPVRNLRARCGRFTYHTPGEMYVRNVVSCVWLRRAVGIAVVGVVSKTNYVVNDAMTTFLISQIEFS